jgi:tRNA-specific 2-thiouridylase
MYTVGQRSGLRLWAAGPSSAPRYVSAIDARTNTIRVGGPDDLLRSHCLVEDVRYVAGPAPEGPFIATVKVRSHAAEAKARVVPLGDEARIEFDEPQRALAPGQAAVFYDGDRVIGGGPIATGGA